MKKYDKIFTDNPFIDELVYFTKTIAVNAVIKDADKADENETVESLKAADLYIACREGRARFDQFEYDLDFLIESSILPPAIIEDCAKENTKIPQKYRKALLEAKSKKYIKEEYIETNNYYRNYMGLPPMEDTKKDFIYLNDDYLSLIPKLDNPELPVHLMNNQDLTILFSHEIIDQLINDYPDKKYLKFMGDNAIDVYKARKAVAFQILYIPTVANRELMDRWNTKYEQNRMYTMKTYYSDAYKMYSDYYNNFIIVFIIIQTMIDIISEVQEFIARRDIFDDRSIRYLFESYGIPYYPEIPRKYQLAMVKNINLLLKWKASTKNMIDICSLFGFDEVDIFRYYLLRDRRVKFDGDNDNTNDDYQFHYKTIIDENGEEKVVPDNDKNYELKFVRAPIEDKADNYLKDKTAYEDYDIITNQDEFWDGKSDHQDIKSAILDQEFSWTRTKYISIDTMYDLSEMCFDLPYFINILVDDTTLEDYLYVKIPTIKNNHQFRVNDLFVYMMAATHVYFGFEDLIMESRPKILNILGFNFHVDMNEVIEDVFNKSFKSLEELNMDGFDIPTTEIMSFNRLLQIFTTNKDIWKVACDGMVHADNKRMYDCYKKVYDSCYIEEYTTTFFTLQDGTIAKTYTEFLKERDYVLYESLEDLRSYTDEISLRKAISDIFVEIVYVLDEYMDSEDFKYVFSKFPAVSGDFVRTYMLKIVNFFKSYKVHLLDISTVYKAFDKRENSIKVYEDWIMSVKKNPTDYVQIIEEITGNIDIDKSDKVKLLEQIYFDIERWEFKDFDDQFIFDIKQQIVDWITEIAYFDMVTVIDHYKDFPFAGLEYTYEKDDRSFIIDSVSPEIAKTIKDKYDILDQIKIITTSETPVDKLVTDLIPGKEFAVTLNNFAPTATNIVFTDTIIPEEKVADATIVSTDISKYKAYMYSDGDTVYVSPDTEKVMIYSNEDSAFMFSNTKLSSLEFTNYNTSKVSNMSHMFEFITTIQTLDLSKFDTYSVMDMVSMFNGCTNLSSLDLSMFNTSKVKDMSGMFSNCYMLNSLNLSSFNTTNVDDMYGMFYRCPNLSVLDVSSFDTSNVKDMSYMFYNCIALESLDLSNFDTSNVDDMSCMFLNCRYLDSLNISNFNTSKVSDMSNIFDGCNNLTTLDVSNFNTTNVESMSYMFSNCTSLLSLDLSNFDTCNVLDMSHMFDNCYSLNSLNISKLDTCKVEDMSYMFYNCNKLVSTITIMNSSIQNYSNMFCQCSTDNGDFLVKFVGGCRVAAKNMVNTKSENSNVYIACAKLISGRELSSTLAEMDLNSAITSVLFTDAAVPEDRKTDAIIVSTMDSLYKIYMYLDGTNAFISPEYDDIIISANKESDFMFYKYSSLISIDFTNFDTTNVENMNSMFNECKSLRTIDVSNFITDNVTDMGNMFNNCQKVATIDVSMFNTSKVKDMSGMFYACKAIRTLDVSDFDTSNVNNMWGMFFQCSGVNVIDVSGFNTSKVTDMASMFNGCGRVSTLDLSSFDTRSCNDMQYMFNSCLRLTSLDLSNFDTSNVNNMTAMFKNCKKLVTLNVSNFNTSKVTEMSSMFFHCEVLTSLDTSKFDGSKVLFFWDNLMFSGCYALTSLDLSNFNASSALTMKDMFKDCQSLTSLNISGFNTTNVTSMYDMFYNCYSLTSLDVSSFDTTNVTTMNGMFWNCKSLTELNVNHFNTSNVIDMREMFKNCSGITSLDISNFDTSKLVDIIDLFYNCSGLTSLDLSNFDTNKVNNMWRTFFNCSSLETLNISNFNTTMVTNMSEMFSNCKVLTSSITISNPDVVERSFVFYDCSIENGSEFIVNYSTGCKDMAQILINTKSATSNVLLGSEV